MFSKIPIIINEKLIYLEVLSTEVEKVLKDPELLEKMYFDQCKNKENVEDDMALYSDEDTEHTKEKETWSHQKILLLIEKYRDFERDFEKTSKRAAIWSKIAEEMKRVNVTCSSVTGQACSVKITGLKRTYKKIKDHNNKSGNSRKSWIYFDVLDDIFSSKAWVNPLATASESGPSTSLTTVKKYDSPKKNKDNLLEEYIEKTEQYRKEKLRLREEKELEKRKRHHEKIELQREMLELFKKQKNH